MHLLGGCSGRRDRQGLCSSKKIFKEALLAVGEHAVRAGETIQACHFLNQFLHVTTVTVLQSY